MKSTKFLKILSLFSLFMGMTLFVQSQVLLYDNFNYPAGDSIIWHNWSTQQTNLTNAILVSSDGLSYAGYPCSGIGNSVAIGTTGQDVFRGFVKQTASGTSLYMSFLVKVTAATTGDAFIAFKESPTSPTNLNYRGRVYAKTDGSNIAFGISKGAITAPATADYTAANYSLNTTYLIVVRYNIVEGTTNDSAFLFVNPVVGSPEPIPTVTATDIAATDVGLGSVLLRQGTTGASPNVIVDGVRVAKSWNLLFTQSDIATLSDLKVDGSTIYGFSSNVFTYNDTVPSGQTSVTVVGTNTDWASTQVANIAPSVPGISTITVTSENGLNINTYTITHAHNFHSVSVTASPVGNGTVNGGGIYGEGLLATVSANPAASYIFVNWTEGGNIVSTNPNYTFTVTGPVNLTANFAPGVYTITAVPSPPDGGTISGAGSATYGSNVTLTATPSEAYNFYNWTENGNVIGNDSVLILTNINANHNIVANFLIKTVTVTVSALPVEGGTVTGGAAYPYGSNATLSATPNEGYIFVNWTEGGNVMGTNPVYTITNINANHDLVANFTVSINTYTVTGIANPPEGGAVSGSGNVTGGGTITLTTTANEGFAFYNWMEGTTVMGTAPTLTLENISANHIIYANFLSTVGLEENITKELKVFPTLTNDILKIVSGQKMSFVQVYTLSGQRVVSYEPFSEELTIDVSNFHPGNYLLKVITNKGIEIVRFFKTN
jgi:hypothetical protein